MYSTDEIVNLIADEIDVLESLIQTTNSPKDKCNYYYSKDALEWVLCLFFGENTIHFW